MKKFWGPCLWFLVIIVSFPQTVNANSSWHWLTARPWDMLPLAIVITIILEAHIIFKYGRVLYLYIVFITVCIANFISFLAPYFIRAYYAWNYFHRGTLTPLKDVSLAFRDAVFQPHYTIEFLYAALTFIIEIPFSIPGAS